MKLRDTLTAPERDELRNVLLNEPVRPGETISHHTANALAARGLIQRDRKGWVARWDVIRDWPRAIGDC